MDPSSFLLGALLVAAKALGIGMVGFGIGWWRARRRVSQLEAERRVDAQPLVDRLERLEGSLDSISGALDRLAAGQRDLQHRLPPPANADASRSPKAS